MMNDDRFTKIRSTVDSKVFSNSLTNFTDKHVRKTNSEENRAEYEEKVSRDGIKSRKPSALGYIYGYRPRRRRREGGPGGPGGGGGRYKLQKWKTGH